MSKIIQIFLIFSNLHDFTQKEAQLTYPVTTGKMQQLYIQYTGLFLIESSIRNVNMGSNRCLGGVQLDPASWVLVGVVQSFREPYFSPHVSYKNVLPRYMQVQLMIFLRIPNFHTEQPCMLSQLLGPAFEFCPLAASMVIWIVDFTGKAYKIRKVFGQKSIP